MTNRLLLTLFIAVLVWSLIHPHDYFTWILEVFPAIIGIILVIAVRKSFPLTPLIAALMAPLLMGRFHDRQLARLAAGSVSHESP